MVALPYTPLQTSPVVLFTELSFSELPSVVDISNSCFLEDWQLRFCLLLLLPLSHLPLFLSNKLSVVIGLLLLQKATLELHCFGEAATLGRRVLNEIETDHDVILVCNDQKAAVC